MSGTKRALRILSGTTLVLALLLGAAPPAKAHGLTMEDDLTTVGFGPVSEDLHLERVWARQQRKFSRISFLFEHSREKLDRVQTLIDEVAAAGGEAAEAQAALDAFAAAIQDARPTFESAKGIIASHRGFDATGKVTDPLLALQTVADMRGVLTDVRSQIGSPARALLSALRDLKEQSSPR